MFLLIAVALPAAAAPGVGDKAPEISARTLQGKPIKLSGALGEGPVLLVFWATWCPNCLREVPELRQLHAYFAGKMRLIGINIGIGDTVEDARAYRRKHALDYDMVFDQSGEIIEDYDVPVTPVLIIVGQSGNIAYRGNELPTEEDIEEYWEDLVR